jgi:hypothetical protein
MLGIQGFLLDVKKTSVAIVMHEQSYKKKYLYYTTTRYASKSHFR